MWLGRPSGGNFVSKAGDTMTGPLTLPADPTSPNQAANKHYVDVGAASKADLLNGTVPTAELGTGTANNGACLHGDSTWGGCGTGGGGARTEAIRAGAETAGCAGADWIITASNATAGGEAVV